jgi:hypothetical protein
MQIFLRAIGHQSDLVTLDAPDDATVEDLIALVADEQNLLPESVRLVFNGRVIQKAVCLSTLTSSASTPITFYGRPQPGEAPPPPDPDPPKPVPPPPVPESSTPPPPPAIPPPPAAPANPALAPLLELGFDADIAERALSLAKGHADVAAELLLNGKVSPEGLHELLASSGDDQFAQIMRQILANEGLVDKALRGEDLLVSVQGQGQTRTMRFANKDIEKFVRARYGTDLRSFVQGGGINRFEPRMAESVDRFQPLLDRQWLEKYERMAPQEKAIVEAMKDLSSDVALIMQVLVGCGGKIDEARRVLEQLRMAG